MSVHRRWPLRLVGLSVLILAGIAPLELGPGQREELPVFSLDPQVEQIARYLEWRATGSIDPTLRRQVANALMEEARYTGLEPALILAVMAVESDFIPDAVSSARAKGLLQLRDITIQEVLRHEELPAKSAIEPMEVVDVRLGIRYLARMMRRYPDRDRALAAWNAGPGAVERELAATGKVPERWLGFAKRVNRQYVRLQELLGDELTPPEQARLAAASSASLSGLD